MMQQPIYQQEQPTTQDPTGQQMVLCPVRVVYETQMLVQPGEQMQANQTILLNPQNPPPWIQNRAVPNQVIYVQQMPQNYLQPTQQHFDPNQLYLQNFGYQNMQPMYVQNPQDQIRPMQMIPPNVVSNIQNSVNTNAQNQRLMPNATQLSHVNAIPHHNIPTPRPVAHNQIAHMNELVNNIRPPDAQTIYRQQAPQSLQQEPKIQIQQNITMIPPNNIQNMPRFPQGYEQNIVQIRSPAPQNVANIQPYQNQIVNAQENRKVVPTVNKGNLHHIPNVSVKGPQNFRPIQPRTIRANGPNIITVQPTNTIQHSMPNIVSATPRKILPHNVTFPNSISITTTGKIEGNTITINRKRKSESPDELHKKASTSNQTESPIIIKRLENISHVNCSDVGVNTSPIHRADGRITINNLEITPLKSNTKNAKIIEELSKPVTTNVPSIPDHIIVKNVTGPSLQILPTDKDKLVRNTVYTQARGRVLNDKEKKVEVKSVETENNASVSTSTSIDNPNDIIIEKINEKQETKPTKEIDLKVSEKLEKNIPTKKEAKIANKGEKKIKAGPRVSKTEPRDSKTQPRESKTEQRESKTELRESKTEPRESKTEPRESKTEPRESKTEPRESKTEPRESKTEPRESKTEPRESKTEPRESKTEPRESKTKPKVNEEKNFILTHVLDGYVIQESNVAFPIRKPLKEKSIQNNTETEPKKEAKNEKETGIRNNSRILDISHLQIKEIEEMDASNDNPTASDEDTVENDNPFESLKLSTLKTWTADELASHLSKFPWNETVALLQEHEIDGESLLLVSKTQLLTIGVSEEHADIICEFVKC